MNMRIAICTALLASAALTGMAWAKPPGPVESSDLYLEPPKTNPSLEKAKGALDQIADASSKAGDQGGALGLGQKALETYKALSDNDKAIDPDLAPAGAPEVPSQCMEDAQCQPCYSEALGTLNKARMGLEKVRGIYEFTNKLAKQGEALMQGVGSMSGGPAAIAASVETFKTEDSLKSFNETVKKKNQELLGKVEVGLHAIGECEAKFYKNDDWYNRFGFMYYQFMLAHYSY